MADDENKVVLIYFRCLRSMKKKVEKVKNKVLLGGDDVWKTCLNMWLI